MSYESLALGCVTLQLGGRGANAYVLGMSYSNPTKLQEPLQRQERKGFCGKLSLTIQQESLAMVKRSFPVLGKL